MPSAAVMPATRPMKDPALIGISPSPDLAVTLAGSPDFRTVQLLFALRLLFGERRRRDAGAVAKPESRSGDSSAVVPASRQPAKAAGSKPLTKTTLPPLVSSLIRRSR